MSDGILLEDSRPATIFEQDRMTTSTKQYNIKNSGVYRLSYFFSGDSCDRNCNGVLEVYKNNRKIQSKDQQAFERHTVFLELDAGDILKLRGLRKYNNGSSAQFVSAVIWRIGS
jgi:hypothetical protein